jgi:hypothetical protein
VRALELEARFPGLLASILKSYAKENSRRDLDARPARPARSARR